MFNLWKKRSFDKRDGTTTPMSQNPHLIPDAPLTLRLVMIVGFLAVLLLVAVTKRP